MISVSSSEWMPSEVSSVSRPISPTDGSACALIFEMMSSASWSAIAPFQNSASPQRAMRLRHLMSNVCRFLRSTPLSAPFGPAVAGDKPSIESPTAGSNKEVLDKRPPVTDDTGKGIGPAKDCCCRADDLRARWPSFRRSASMRGRAWPCAATAAVTRIERLYRGRRGQHPHAWKSARDPLEAILINTAGGLTGGDRIAWEIEAAAGASVTVTTQACEKALPLALRRRARRGQAIGGRRRPHRWLPQETIAYRPLLPSPGGSKSTSPKSAEALIVEATLFGRLRHGRDRVAGALP